MRRWVWAAAAAALLAVALGAWILAGGDADDAASDVTAEGTTGDVAIATTSTTMSTTPAETSTTTTASEATSTTTTTTTAPNDPFAGRVLFDPDGLNVVDIGATMEDAVRILNAALGRTPDGQIGDRVRYGYLEVRFGQDGIFDCYNAHPNYGENLGLTTREGIGLGSTRNELAAAYGDRVEWTDGARFLIRFPSGAIGGGAHPIDNGEIFEIWGGAEDCPG